MKNNFIITVCAALVLTACSSPGSRERTSGGYEYLEAIQESIDLKVPENLEQPKRSNQYDLPILKSDNNAKILLGHDLRITSPRLVLALVAGSSVEEGSDSATVTFDQVNDEKALDATIWDKVLGYLELNDIGVESFDRENNTLTTDWVMTKIKIDTSWYSFRSAFVEEAKKFQLSLNMEAHGRSASLTSEIVDYIDRNGVSSITSIDPITQRNNEVEFLNFIIEEYDVGIRMEIEERIAKIRDGFSSTLGFNADGESAILVDADYNNAWPRLLLVFRKMGFDVVDLDQSSGIMFVLYDGVEEGFWSGLFSDETLLLDKDNYRVYVSSAGAQTSVTFKSADNVAFDPKQVTDIFPIFKEHMASDSLDIN